MTYIRRKPLNPKVRGQSTVKLKIGKEYTKTSKKHSAITKAYPKPTSLEALSWRKLKAKNECRGSCKNKMLRQVQGTPAKILEKT
jgi:hypothetical protein